MAREWTDLDYAQAAIDMLPGSVEEIAELFRVHNITGVRSDSHSCPMAKWVRKWTGVESAVGWMLVQVNTAVIPCVWIDQPPHVTAFVRAFDAGRIKL